MKRFSISDAAFSGFGLVFRRPLTVFVWGLVSFLFLIVPAIPLMNFYTSQYIPALMSIMSNGSDRASVDSAMGHLALMGLQQNQGMIGLVMLCSLIGRSILMAAVNRAILEPDKKRFFSLGFGIAELVVGAVSLCLSIFLTIIIVFAALVMVIVGGIIGAVAAQANSSLTGPVTAVLFIAIVGGFVVFVIHLCLRFSLATPMSFEARGFKLFESWGATRGQTWRLFATMLLLLLFVFIAEMIVVALVGIGLLAAGAPLTPNGLDIFAHRPPLELAQKFLPVLIGLSLVGSFFYGATYAVGYAPFAEAWRQLRTRD